MKIKLGIAAVVAVLAIGWACHAFAGTASASFSYDFSADVPCTTTVTTDCVDHFEIWDITGTAKQVSPSIPVPNPISASVAATFKVGPPYGTRKWSVIAVAKDGTSSNINAASAQSTVQVRPGTPASVVINLN